MATVSVIVPTVPGREDWLDRCVAGYEEHTPDVQVIVIRGEQTCGHAWVKGAKKAKGGYLHFTADDLVPFAGWLEAAVEVSDRGEIPAANVLTVETADGWDPGSTMSALAYLRGNRATPNVLVPFLSRDLFRQGEWLLPIHYGSDDWVTFLADVLNIRTPFLADYAFGHGAHAAGRLHDSRIRDIPILLDHMAEHGEPPTAYVQMGRAYGWFPETVATVVIRDGAVGVADPEITEAPSYYWNGPTLPVVPA